MDEKRFRSRIRRQTLSSTQGYKSKQNRPNNKRERLRKSPVAIDKSRNNIRTKYHYRIQF